MPPRFAVFCRYCDRKLAATAAETRGKAPYHAPVAPIDVETLPKHCKYPSNQLGVHFSGYGYTSSWLGVHFLGYGYTPS